MEVTLDLNFLILASIYLLANLFAFISMGFDKARAVVRGKRISEAHLLFLSICFCALGALLGMLIFRHKIRNIYFAAGVPLALLENLGLFYLVLQFF